MPSQKITFVGANGTELAARLDLSLEDACAYAIFAHCFTCSKDTKAATYLSAALAEQGIAMLRFDFTGLGGSGGDFANTNFSSNVADLVAAADYLRANHGTPEILIGHSLGGTAVLAAAPKIADVRAIATINAPFDPAHVLHMMAAARPEIELAGEAEVTLGGRPFRIKKQFIEDIEQHRVTEGLKRMKKALLVMHAPRRRDVRGIGAGRMGHALHLARLSDAADAPWAESGEVIVADAGTGKYEHPIISIWPMRIRASCRLRMGLRAKLQRAGCGRYREFMAFLKSFVVTLPFPSCVASLERPLSWFAWWLAPRFRWIRSARAARGGSWRRFS